VIGEIGDGVYESAHLENALDPIKLSQFRDHSRQEAQSARARGCSRFRLRNLLTDFSGPRPRRSGARKHQ
jgi:hypothetical protein